MAKKDRNDREEKGATGAPKSGRTKVTLTLDDELAWRFGVLARMKRVGLGELIEPAIREMVKEVRLPYHSVGSKPKAPGTSTDGSVASQGIEADPPVEAVPIREGIHPSPIVDTSAAPGAGEGVGDHSPAAVPKRRRA